MEYKEGMSYSISEEKNIYEWLKTHKEYAVDVFVGDHLEIHKNTDLSYMILEYKEYLTQTDYVVSKIAEALIEGNADLVSELKEHYADVLEKRAEARRKINELEQ